MNLGILKLYSFILVIISTLVFTSCSYKNWNDFFYNKNIINKEKKVLKKDVNQTIKIDKKKAISKKEITIKQENINNKDKDDIPFAVVVDEVEVQNKTKTTKTKIVKEKYKQTKDIKTDNTKNIEYIDNKVNQNINIDYKNNKLKYSTQLDKNKLENFQFDLIKKGSQDDNTFLIVGGIQGDEPGGFMAASLIATHYKITKGSVWVVPNLNFYSIIKRNRGPFGDMNRKFAKLSKDDPEYEIIQRIKSYIKDPSVKLILNLHDGSGFYRKKYIDNNHQPLKWGQSSVIDQEVLPNVNEYANTYDISEQIVKHINKHLLKKEDEYRTKNTHTRFKDTNEEMEMAKTLTFYAVSHGKSAFGHETSKSLNVEQRVYYKLLAIEKYMDIMGIEYERKFKLNEKSIKKVLDNDISIKFNDTDVQMPLKNIRNIQKYFPIDKNGVVKYLPSNPLIKIIKSNNEYTIYYGNRRLTHLQADYKEHLNFNTTIDFLIDNENKQVKFGDTVFVKDNFLIKKSDFRVNVIGFKNKKGPLETDIKIYKNKFLKRYSIEKNANIYRVEFYKEDKFAGMILVKYN